MKPDASQRHRRSPEEISRKEALAKAEREAMDDVIHAVVTTEDGAALLQHLAEKYDLTGRTFRASDNESGKTICPYKAAIRDGERSVINYLIQGANRALSKKGKKQKFKLSIQ